MLTVKCLFLRMNPLMLQENLQEKPARVILIKIYLKKEFMLKAEPIKYLLWKEHLQVQV